MKAVNYLLTRFSSKHQSFLLSRSFSLLTRFIFMLTRYGRLVYKFTFTSTVDFLIYFTHTTSNEYMRLNYTFFIIKITLLNRN